MAKLLAFSLRKESARVCLILVLAIFNIAFVAHASAHAATRLPMLEKAKPYLPLLVEAARDIWPQAPSLSFFAAQVEQESLWNPNATLRTSREWGAGLGQFTVAYRSDGSVIFDKMAEVRVTHKALAGWVDRYDPGYQLKAVVVLDRSIYNRMTRMCDVVYDCLSFTASAYNGGEGGLLQDRRLCAHTEGCDPRRWRENVALNSTKSKVKWQGYGKSAFEINREYVHNVLYVRRQKYVTYLGT